MAYIVNTIFSIFTVAAQILSLVLLVVLIAGKKDSPLLKLWADHALTFSFIIALIAMLGSLTYSNVLGYTPCELCWFQRIFMYPQAFLLGIAAWRKEKMMLLYSIVLSSIGAVISLYHCFLQFGFNPLGVGCAAMGQSVSCAKVFVLQFGYITIPMMALSAFILIIITSVLGLNKKAQ